MAAAVVRCHSRAHSLPVRLVTLYFLVTGVSYTLLLPGSTQSTVGATRYSPDAHTHTFKQIAFYKNRRNSRSSEDTSVLQLRSLFFLIIGCSLKTFLMVITYSFGREEQCQFINVSFVWPEYFCFECLTR